MQLVVLGQCVMRMPANLNWEGRSTVPFSTSLAWVAMIAWGGLIPDQAAGARVLVLDCIFLSFQNMLVYNNPPREM